MALSKVDLANQVENQLPQNLVANNLPFRNIIINGDMSIAQRGTSTASITSSGYYTVDRFGTAISSLGTWTNSQSTDVPTGQGFASSFKLDCTTADASPAASDNLRVFTKFEGQNLQYLKKGTASAVSLTASFWVKSTKTGTFILELQDVDNARTISKSYTVDVTNTWEKKTITYEGDTTGAYDNDNNGSLQLNFWLGAGTDFTSGTLNTTWNANTNANRAVGQVNLADSTSNEWYITGVQLEAGTTASDFEFLPVDVNLARCQRYLLTFGNSNNFIGHFYATNTVNASIYFPNKLRADPTVSCTSLTNSIRVYSAGVLRYSSTFADNGVTAEQGELSASVTGGTAGNALTANINNGGFLLQFDAEL